jgi:hypothetical protein
MIWVNNPANICIAKSFFYIDENSILDAINPEEKSSY